VAKEDSTLSPISEKTLEASAFSNAKHPEYQPSKSPTPPEIATEEANHHETEVSTEKTLENQQSAETAEIDLILNYGLGLFLCQKIIKKFNNHVIYCRNTERSPKARRIVA